MSESCQRAGGLPESGVSGIETPPPLEELGLEDAVGVEIGVLKLAEVTNDRKLSNWRRDSALCNVSSGRMLGIPMENPVKSKAVKFLYFTLSYITSMV